MAAPQAVGPLDGQGYKTPLPLPIRDTQKIKDFFFEIGRKIYPDAPPKNPLPELKWSWEEPFSLLNYRINSITMSQMPNRVMALYSFTGRLVGIAIKILPYRNSVANTITVYDIGNRFTERYDFDPMNTFIVTKSLDPDLVPSLREHLIWPIYLRS